MKKLLLIIFLFTSASNSFGQFLLTHEGLFVDSLTQKDFIVKTYDGVSQDILYQFVENKVLELFNSPKDVLSKTDDAISIRGIIEVPDKVLGMVVNRPYTFKILIQFKDNKIRYSIGRWDSNSIAVSDFFNKKGKLRQRKIFLDAYRGMNKALNNFISKLFYTEDNSVLEWE